MGSPPRNLTPKMKRDWLDIIIKRDGGQVCFYCKISLSLSEIVWEHLDNNRTHNVIDNLVLACSTCNNKKPHNYDMQIIAQDKLQDNIKSNYMREIINSKNKQTSEIQISTTNFDIAEIFLHKNVPIDFTEALNSITYECRKKTGYGSQQSVRLYIDSLTSVRAPFEVYKHGKEKTIRYKRDYLKSNKG